MKKVLVIQPEYEIEIAYPNWLGMWMPAIINHLKIKVTKNKPKGRTFSSIIVDEIINP